MPHSTDESTQPRRARLLALLFAISFVSYVERSNLSVSAELMMPALGMSRRDLAAVFNSFLIGYALFQVPAGWLGDRFSPRKVLAWSALLWGVITLLTGLLPGTLLRTAFGTLALLCMLRFLLGATEASTFPVAAHAVERWIPSARRGLGNALMLSGSSVASALTAPFVSWSMLRFGWRASFYATAAAALVVALLWFRLRPPPRLVAPVPAPAAAASEPGPAPASVPGAHRPRWLRTEVVLLSLSYVSEGYLLFTFVYWLYIYLVEVRHFSLARGGLVASLPWITAIVATPLGGLFSDRLANRFSRSTSARILVITGYTLSGGLLLAAALAPGPAIAVLALCLSLGGLYLAESSFWTIATLIGGRDVGAVSGLMNTLGILGGIASNSVIPRLVEHFGPRGWILAFASGTAMGLFCSAIWLLFGRRIGHAVPTQPSLITNT